MNAQQKKIVSFSIIGVVFAVFVYAFIQQWASNGSPADSAEQAEKSSQTAQNQQREQVEKEIGQQSAAAETSNPANSGQSITKQDKKQSKQVAVDFAKKWFEFDADHPLQHIKAVKPYVTQDFYTLHKKNPPRGTALRDKAETLTVDVYPVDVAPEGKIVWNVIVLGNVTTSKGKVNKREIWYFIKLGSYDGEWKVEGVQLR